jgi:hypothetical protein
MLRWISMPLWAGAIAVLVGCTAGRAPDSEERAIADDVAATHDHGPTSLFPGMDGRDEPSAAFPWNTN